MGGVGKVSVTTNHQGRSLLSVVAVSLSGLGWIGSPEIPQWKTPRPVQLTQRSSLEKIV